MTPQEKAEELINMFSLVGLQQRNEGIVCALIAVENIIKETLLHDKTTYQHGRTAYWKSVYKEIQNK